jgi:UDP-glucose:(heptosyl)LPS alpha-1,3-glucosyltransferase
VRVAVVIERFGDFAGGVERAAFELLRELGRRAVDVTALCRVARRAPPPGVRVVELGGPRAWQPLRVRVFSRRAAAATRDRFEVVHAYSRTRWQDIYRAGGGSHAQYMEQVYRAPRLQRLLSPRHRTILAIEEAVFRDPRQLVQCISRRDAAEIARRYALPAARLATVYNGVDIRRFHPEQRKLHREAVRAQLRLDGPVALFAGHGFYRKGLDRAIRALADSAVQAQLVVAGADPPGRFAALARALGVERRVRFAGAQRAMETLYAAADLLLFPSRYDSFGSAVLEALAAGLPVACAPSAGACELIEPGRNGLICAEDFAPAIDLLGDPAALARMGAAARATAETYTWERHADRVLELYRRVIEARR